MKENFNKKSERISYEDRLLLNEAATNGDNDTIVAILKEHPDAIDQPVGPFYVNHTVLQTAAALGHKDTVELLLKLGANVDKPSVMFGAALSRAVRSGHIEIAKLLLDNGANVNGVPDDGWTPLTAAVELLRVDMVKLLLERGADVNQKAYDGSTILEQLAESIERNMNEYNVHDALQVPKLGRQIEALIRQKAANNNTPKTNIRKHTP
jgi:ankyrin repeat protein